jgi:hypothetical protein
MGKFVLLFNLQEFREQLFLSHLIMVHVNVDQWLGDIKRLNITD